MSLEYIRKYYGVPARRGARVRYKSMGAPKEVIGVITGSRGSYIRMRPDGETKTRIYHPTYNLTYL